jgi:hypothetical protein
VYEKVRDIRKNGYSVRDFADKHTDIHTYIPTDDLLVLYCVFSVVGLVTITTGSKVSIPRSKKISQQPWHESS